jgi:hypothetical protein
VAQWMLDQVPESTRRTAPNPHEPPGPGAAANSRWLQNSYRG